MVSLGDDEAMTDHGEPDLKPTINTRVQDSFKSSFKLIKNTAHDVDVKPRR